MASCYTLDHVIQECVREKANVNTTARGKSTDAKIEIYGSAWLALNTWIESRLAKHKSASVGGFATFAWEMMERNGETHCRPLFLISESYVKLHHIKRQRIHRVPQLTPVEEVNYSLLAIRYTKNLTKDMVLSGIRDILKKMGDFAMRGYEMQIDFTFGSFYAKENKVKFIFNQSRLLEILPENLEPGVMAKDLEPMRYVIQEQDRSTEVTPRPGSARPSSGPETNNRRPNSALPQVNTGRKSVDLSSIPKPNVPALQLPTQKNKVPHLGASYTMTSTANSSNNSNNANNGGSAGYNTTMNFSSVNNGNNNNTEDFSKSTGNFNIDTSSTNTYPEYAKTGTPSDLSEVLDAIANRARDVNKKEWREAAKARVEAQAFRRCLEDLESNATEEEIRKFEERKQLETWKSTLNMEKQKIHDQIKGLKQALDDQIEKNRIKSEQDRIEQRGSVSKFFLGDSAGFTPSPLGAVIDENGKVLNSRQRISKDLENQIKTNIERKETTKRETLKKEQEHLARVAIEAEMQSVMDRASHLEKQRALLEAWERDGHVRNLRKLQPHGTGMVKDYIDRNLVDVPSTPSFTNTLGQSLNMSIGYDPRTGKH